MLQQDAKDTEQDKQTNRDEKTERVRPLYPRNVVAVGDDTQGGFEGITATNKVDIPRTKRKFEHPQDETDAYQGELLEISG